MRQTDGIRRLLFVSGVCALAACVPIAVSPTAIQATPTATATANPNLGCTTVEAAPTASSASLLPPVTSSDFTRGPEHAPVTMLLYCDFQSPQCEIFNRVLDDLIAANGDQLQVVYRLYPVPVAAVASLDKSEASVRAAIAAGHQGKFWEMRDILHHQYLEWVSLSPAEFRAWVRRQAADLGLDADRFASDLESAEIAEQARTSYQAASALGISGIPTVFINGRLQERPALSYSGLESTIGLTALGQRQFRTCPPFKIDTSLEYLATIHTLKGDIVIQLEADRAPLAVNSFVFLAGSGWYDGSTFHRVVPGFLAQGGDPSGTGNGGPGYLFKNEIYSDLQFDRPGVVGMANSGPDTNGSQFFITLAPQPQLDGSYTVFGHVVQGMEVVESLTPRDPQISPGAPPGDTIINISIIAK